MRREKENIIPIGMPGVGKTTVGKALGKEMGRTCVDVDHELEKLETFPHTLQNKGNLPSVKKRRK